MKKAAKKTTSRSAPQARPRGKAPPRRATAPARRESTRADAKGVTVIGILGSTLDAASPDGRRWERWRPSVGLCQQDDFVVDRFDLIHSAKHTSLLEIVSEDIASVSPETEVVPHVMEFRNPWDFEEVFGKLHSWARAYPFDPDQNDYLIHITTGTHVAQICLFLLTESRHLPGRLLQTSPPPPRRPGPGTIQVIDLDLSRYDRISMRFAEDRQSALSFLKSGIETRNKTFNDLIERIEQVAIASTAPILLSGPTGAGKSQLARRIYELKVHRRQINGAFVEANCATLRGDSAMSALFGHKAGAFTGAQKERAGLLQRADGGMLFLDEIGELGPDEQAMLLRALEEKRFLPLGGDDESESDFQLIAGTNRNLQQAVRRGRFRDDLLARIDLWSFTLPGLRQRREDIEPNLQYELDRFAQVTGRRITFNKEARDHFLRFATHPDALWAGNFRDLNAAVTRMATLAPGGRIHRAVAEEEIARLLSSWEREAPHYPQLESLVGVAGVAAIDPFDRMQLEGVIAVCRRCRTLSEAGRRLFAVSREKKKSSNDADRLRKYLARFALEWDQLGAASEWGETGDSGER